MVGAFAHGLANRAVFAQQIIPCLTRIPGASLAGRGVRGYVAGDLLVRNLRQIVEGR